MQDMIGFAFTKVSDASSNSVSMLTRIDAAYDALLMFSVALFTSNGFRVSTDPRDDRFAFEGMAYVLELPEDVFADILKLSKWPLRKYSEGLNVSNEWLADILRSVRLVIKHVNLWLRGANGFVAQIR